MFNKLLSFLLIFATLTVTSQASTNNGLKEAVDELRYSLTVEWDQRDESKKAEYIQNFNSSLAALEAEGKLGKEELIAFAVNEIEDKRVAEDVRSTLTLLSAGVITTEEASESIHQMLQHSYKTGASWNGRVVAEVLLVTTLFVGLLSLCIWMNVKDRGECHVDFQ